MRASRTTLAQRGVSLRMRAANCRGAAADFIALREDALFDFGVLQSLVADGVELAHDFWGQAARADQALPVEHFHRRIALLGHGGQFGQQG